MYCSLQLHKVLFHCVLFLWYPLPFNLPFALKSYKKYPLDLDLYTGYLYSISKVYYDYKCLCALFATKPGFL